MQPKKSIRVVAARNSIARAHAHELGATTAADPAELHPSVLRLAGPIAVLDDDLAAGTSLCAGLRTQGFEAVAFSEPCALWSSFLLTPFIAFVLDWTLESGTSESLIASLRQDEHAATAPIFLLSGNMAACGIPLERDVAAAVAAYRLQFRAKPYSCLRLAAELRSMLSAGQAPARGG